jgi:hypothetical protein
LFEKLTQQISVKVMVIFTQGYVENFKLFWSENRWCFWMFCWGGGRGIGNFPTFLLKIGSGAAAHWILDHGSGIWV